MQNDQIDEDEIEVSGQDSTVSYELELLRKYNFWKRRAPFRKDLQVLINWTYLNKYYCISILMRMYLYLELWSQKNVINDIEKS